MFHTTSLWFYTVKAYFHRLGEAAAVKCMSCRHNKYQPFSPGRSDHRIAFQPAKISCEEGIHTFYSIRSKGLPTTIVLLKSPKSKARAAILACGFWEPKIV